MNIYKLDKNSIPVVAKLMARIKPEWWDVEGAAKYLWRQLSWDFIG